MTSPFEAVIAYACEHRHVTRKGILGSCREASFVKGRWLVAWILRRYYGFSLADIGHVLKRDHTTVSNGITRFGELLLDETHEGRHYKRLADNYRAVMTGGVVKRGAA